jgi:hypothetical protein
MTVSDRTSTSMASAITNAVLASTATSLGRTLRIHYNSQDLRVVRAFAANGAEIDVLKAQGAWGEIVHDLKLRQALGCRHEPHRSNAFNEKFAPFKGQSGILVAVHPVVSSGKF